MKKYISLLSLLIIFGTIYWGFSDMMPSVNNKQTIEETDFSIENALQHLKEISEHTHYVGSKAHKKVQDYLVHEFEKLNLKPQIQTQTVINRKWFAATTSENILVRIKGAENGKALLLLSHYDSSPHSSLGASDAGSGVVTILEGIRAFLAEGETPKNDIIILISDAEELGLLGAKAFVEQHVWAKDVGLVLNFEARGSGGPSYMLMEINGKNGKLLDEFIKANPNYPAANSLMYSIYKMLPNDTDLTVFREEGNINGFNFAFIDDHFDYHTAQDSYERLDRETLLHQADYLTTTLNYFANSDLNSFHSEVDYIYVNFPFIKLLTYPFSWVFPMFVIAFVLFLTLLFIGIISHKITLKGTLKGFLPFLISLIVCTGISWGLWKLLVFIHPHYQDILHGFTYNGYQYITAFTLLNLWLLFKIYSSFMKPEKIAETFIAPIFIWLLINFFIYKNLQGAGFFILPVFSALLILGVVIFTTIKTKYKTLLFAIISIPTLYIFTPFIKMFPVGLGLKNLFISALFLVLIFGMLLPVFSFIKGRKRWVQIIGFFTLVCFVAATYNSGFSEDNKKPNSLIYVQNEETNTAYFASYNTTLDAYTKAVLGENPIKGTFEKNAINSKYKTRLKYYVKTANKAILTSKITIEEDTIIGNKRNISFTVLPQRKTNKIEFISNEAIHFHQLKVNGVFANKQNGISIKNGTFLSYTMGNSDSEIKISMIVDIDANPTILLKEISYDLLTHPQFNIPPRTNEMMPMPFVVNDAIITLQKLKL